MSSSLAPAAAPALEPATAPLESAAADVEIISPSPYHPRKMLNPGVLQWDTFNFLMRGVRMPKLLHWSSFDNRDPRTAAPRHVPLPSHTSTDPSSSSARSSLVSPPGSGAGSDPVAANVFCGLEALQLVGCSDGRSVLISSDDGAQLCGARSSWSRRGRARICPYDPFHLQQSSTLCTDDGTARTNALGLKKCTEALMTIYEHSLSCYSTVHDYPMPEKEVVKVDDVVMAEVKEEVKEEEAARVERGKFEDQAGESEIKQDDHDDDEDFKEEEDEDEEDEIIVPRGTRSRGRTAATLKYTPKRPIKSIPARSKVPKVSKYPDPPPLAPEVQAPLDLAREAYKKSFMADLADQKGFLLALKAAQSSTELFVHKFFGEKSLEAVDQPSQAQLTRVAEEAKRKVAFETERLKKEREAKQKVKTEAVEPEVKVEGGAL